MREDIGMPAAGELVWIDFDPAFGHEQAGRRPALVISDKTYNTASSFVLVCPITRSQTPWPFKLRLSDDLPVEGQILVDQIKSVDSRRIVSPAIAKIDDGLMSRVREILAQLLGLTHAKRGGR
jgi:mRNA interferase MazF